jgi:AmiR/NasT family two-component response regulator
VPDDDFQALRDEIERLVAAALKSERDHADALAKQSHVHTAELAKQAEVHAAEVVALADVANVDGDKLKAAIEDVEQLKEALQTRDVIGQAKGILVAVLHCTSDHAFELLVAQSQSENRKVSQVAAEVVARAQRPSPSKQ